jgi:hypothetical protein
MFAQVTAVPEMTVLTPIATSHRDTSHSTEYPTLDWSIAT